MPDRGNIAWLTRDKLDAGRWDDCIKKSPNGLVYGYSFYLDVICERWDALVLNNYEAVMPLCWNKKWGIHYLYQPFLTAQLGLFGPRIDAELLESFLKAVPARFKYWDIYLNHQNIFSLRDFNLYTRSNYVLNLATPHEYLYKNYRENIQRNIRKCMQSGASAQKDIPVEKVIELAKGQMKEFGKEAEKNLDRFRKLYAELQGRQMALTRGIVSAEGELLASAVFFFSHNRAYYILVGNHPDGKALGTSHALIDAFIQEYAGKNLLLDFEGSDIPSLAFFYSGFGALEEKYAGLKLNRLPFYVKWLKK
ncbi:MAG TPA: GNAT family N-acetyltransferase [Chitinophagaceae bacterium]|nr:GNAT family N-acetyltransferase [Chitinophagaceae bacterium]HEX5654908.1 GNAT family N-acetyltransferase [Chitinophagaceae bacterium]